MILRRIMETGKIRIDVSGAGVAKVHGMPVRALVTAGTTEDCRYAEALIERIPAE